MRNPCGPSDTIAGSTPSRGTPVMCQKSLPEQSAAFSSSAGTVEVCQGGAGIPFSEELAKQVLSQPEIQIQVDLGQGAESATAWGCDLSYDYVKINGDYRT